MKNRKLATLKENFLENPPIMLRQKGYDCRSYALAAVLQWLFDSKLINHRPMPPRQRNNGEYKGSSIRHLLKHHFHSAVGEVNNVEDLAAVAEKQDEIAAYFCQCKLEAQYYATLKKAIDQGLSPIIFFEIENNDMNHRIGLPVNKGGKIGHAAPVIGYFYDRNNHLFFRVSQWEEHFNLDAKELFASTSQLVHHRTVANSYFKIKTLKNEGGWISESEIFSCGLVGRVIKRKLETNPTRNEGLRQKILIIDSKIKPRFKAGEMPVRFNRPTASSVSEIKTLPSKDCDRDKKWDEQIENNLKNLALQEKLEEIERNRSTSCLVPATRGRCEDWDFNTKIAKEDDWINLTVNLNPDSRLLLFSLPEPKPLPLSPLEQMQELKLKMT